jgi:hypothetical protein
VPGVETCAIETECERLRTDESLDVIFDRVGGASLY